MNEYQAAFERLCMHTEQLQKFQLVDDKAFDKGAYEEDKKKIEHLVSLATFMKVKKNVEEFSYCPNCSMVVAEKNRIKSMNYCSHCGQALDWSDEE